MSDEVITAEAVEAPKADVSKYTADDLQKQLKPLSKNGFVRFFQKIGRGWLGAWYGFADKHPKLSDLIYKAFFLIVFSQLVTIWQFIVMAVVPLFLTKTGAVGWPMIPLEAAGGKNFIIFGDESGWANFICFEIAVFTAQCINFPLQRNITYRSHGNPWIQALWYFIGWVLVSLFTNTIWGLCNAFLLHWNVPEIVNGIIKTVLTGGVSLVIFFFIFMIIFPDNNKMAKKSKKKYDKLVAKNAPTAKVVNAENKMKLWEDKATKSNAEKDYFKAKSQVNAAVMKYNAIVKASQKPNLKEAQKAAYPAKIAKAFENAVIAIETRNEKQAEFEASKAI